MNYRAELDELRARYRSLSNNVPYVAESPLIEDLLAYAEKVTAENERLRNEKDEWNKKAILCARNYSEAEIEAERLGKLLDEAGEAIDSLIHDSDEPRIEIEIRAADVLDRIEAERAEPGATR